MLKDGVKVYKMKYVRDDIKNDSQWTVNIIAMGWNDAENYLRSQFTERIRIEERGGTADIDAVTPLATVPVKPTVITKTLVKEPEDSTDKEETGDVATTADGRIICPWCAKSYKTLGFLMAHVKKVHME